MNIIVDFVDTLGAIPDKLGSGQSIIDFEGRKVIRTERDDGIYGGAFRKVVIKEASIKYISSTMSEKQLIEYITII